MSDADLRAYVCPACGEQYEFPDTGTAKECLECHGYCQPMENFEQLRKEAFVAGFMATGEGLNGEFVPNGMPRDVAEMKFEHWADD